MILIQNGTQGPTTPPAKQVAVGTPGYAYGGPPGSTPSSRWDQDVANTLLAEGVAIATATGASLDPTNNAQQLAAIMTLAGANKQVVTAGTTTLTAAQAGLVEVDASGGNVTINLPAPASAGNQRFEFEFYRTDTSTHTVTISTATGTFAPSGATSLLMPAYNGNGGSYPVVRVVSDGANYLVNGLSRGILNTVDLLTSGSWTVPAGVFQFEVEVWSGSGGSGGSANGFDGAGGNSGAYSRKLVSTAPATVYTYVVGGAGTAGLGAPFGGNGGNGGASSFSTIITCTGGIGGGGGSSSPGLPSNTLAVAVGGDFNLGGNIGEPGLSGIGGGGGPCPFGGPGGVSATSQGAHGIFPGGGAGGGANGNGGNVGGNGYIRIRY